MRVNPISQRLQITYLYPFVYHSKYLFLYSSVLHYVSLIKNYVEKLINQKRLRNLLLLSKVKIFISYKKIDLSIFFFSDAIYGLYQDIFFDTWDEFIPTKLSEMNKLGLYSLKRRRDMRILEKKIRKGLYIRGRTGKINKKKTLIKKEILLKKRKKKLFIFFYFFFMKNVILLHTNFLRMIISRDLTLFFGHNLIIPSFVMIPQEKLSAEGWARLICFKLQSNFRFGKIMSDILYILNHLIKFENLTGYKIVCNGRLSRRGRSSSLLRSRGSMPLSTYCTYVDYSYQSVVLKNSICGIKVWLYYKKNPRWFNRWSLPRKIMGKEFFVTC